MRSWRRPGCCWTSTGLDGTGLNAIAREAGLSKPNLYVYFESREAILLRLLLKGIRSLGQGFEKAV